MTGDSDYLLRIVVPDLEAYERFVMDFTKIAGIAQIRSSLRAAHGQAGRGVAAVALGRHAKTGLMALVACPVQAEQTYGLALEDHVERRFGGAADARGSRRRRSLRAALSLPCLRPPARHRLPGRSDVGTQITVDPA